MIGGEDYATSGNAVIGSRLANLRDVAPRIGRHRLRFEFLFDCVNFCGLLCDRVT